MSPAAQPAAYVELTQAAVEDLQYLAARAPVVLEWALKKMILLEKNPRAGEPLLGSLVGFRKLVVGDRGWRIVWRVTRDQTGAEVVEIAEVWAVGVRPEGEVYAEMTARVAAMPPAPETTALADVIGQLGRLAAGVTAMARRAAAEPVPDWLQRRLIHTVGLDPADVEHLSLEEAVDAWTEWRSEPR